MSFVIASNVPATVGIKKVEEFFSFCGKIKSVKPLDVKQEGHLFEIEFESTKALSTAELLDDAELDGSQIKVLVVARGGAASVAAADALNQKKSTNTSSVSSSPGGASLGDFKDNPPAYKEVGAPPCTPISTSLSSVHENKFEDNKIQANTSVTHTGDDRYDQVTQEEKPKYAIMAQLLASGYILSDRVIEKSVLVDKEKGYSKNVKNFLSHIDEKFIGTQKQDSLANKFRNQSLEAWNSGGYGDKLKHYLDKAASTSYGAKAQQLYQSMSKEVTEVHQEALRLKDLKKPSPELPIVPTDDKLPEVSFTPPERPPSAVSTGSAAITSASGISASSDSTPMKQTSGPPPPPRPSSAGTATQK